MEVGKIKKKKVEHVIVEHKEYYFAWVFFVFMSAVIIVADWLILLLFGENKFSWIAVTANFFIIHIWLYYTGAYKPVEIKRVEHVIK